MEFVPSKVYFERDALHYELSRHMYKKLLEHGVPIEEISSGQGVESGEKSELREIFFKSKRIVVVRVRRSGKFESCRPSAHFQLPLVSGCPAHCEYCYLHTRFGEKPYMRVYANLDEILALVGKRISERMPELTVFEGSAASDPVALEPWTGSLQNTIEFFGKEQYGRFRFVTKYSQVESLLDAKHNNHTEIRFSLNADYVSSKFERGVPSLGKRIKAASLVGDAGYRLGFLIGPILVYERWENGYEEMFELLRENISPAIAKHVTFELITHRFTGKARSIIQKIYPDTELDMDEAKRQFKYGQFGYGKYVYKKEILKEVQSKMQNLVLEYFPDSKILYFV